MTHFDFLETSAELTGIESTRFYPKHGKRLLDIVLCFMLLPIILPIIGMTWAATRLQGGPGFFAHTRIGKTGQPFQCFKIRTMHRNSDQILLNHLQKNLDAAKEWGRCRKLRSDPRITQLGCFLRRTSLDELPQILNVLRGDMSLVGPRPITEDELAYYAPKLSTYLSQKPGITGPWQIHGRHDGCYKARVRLDQSYMHEVSLLTDLALISRTALTIIRPSGC
jgi:exopolysaccharide production protein ExoY